VSGHSVIVALKDCGEDGFIGQLYVINFLDVSGFEVGEAELNEVKGQPTFGTCVLRLCQY
jgi:hypothetical protein